MDSKEKASPWTFPQSTGTDDAVFLGWQKSRSGRIVALYTVTAEGHPSVGSTVTDESLLRLHLQIPHTPLRPEKQGWR